ncbi:hypothetical protein MMC19_000523 [Ptychographa xylographoides]|nr:hypothetical protein [Ptychographa xylographoides]
MATGVLRESDGAGCVPSVTKEIIISSGVSLSPHTLMVSDIGRAATVEFLDVPPSRLSKEPVQISGYDLHKPAPVHLNPLLVDCDHQQDQAYFKLSFPINTPIISGSIDPTFLPRATDDQHVIWDRTAY